MKTIEERIKALRKKYPYLAKPSLMVAATEEQWDYFLEHNRREDAVELFRQHPDYHDLRDDYVNLLIEEEKYEEAINVLNDGIMTFNKEVTQCLNWVDKELEVLENIDDDKKVIEYLQWLFIYGFNPVDCYDRLKSLIPSEELQPLLRELIDKAVWKEDAGLMLSPIYEKEGQYDKIYQALYETKDVLAETGSSSFTYGFDYTRTFFKVYAKYLSSEQRMSIVVKIGEALREYAVNARKMPKTAYLYESLCHLRLVCKESKKVADELVEELINKYNRRKELIELLSNYYD